MTKRQKHKNKKRPRSWHRRGNAPDRALLEFDLANARIICPSCLEEFPSKRKLKTHLYVTNNHRFGFGL